jgi:hypothetical protein
MLAIVHEPNYYETCCMLQGVSYVHHEPANSIHKKPNAHQNKTTPPAVLALQQESKALTRVRSQIRVPAISSSSAGTACRFNGYDERCIGPARSALFTCRRGIGS